ncbi:MAG: lysylphosphatidylglycerol synthase domain-containing protein [Cyanobacteriota bacterium]
MKQIGSSLKPYLRWVILVGVLFFLGKALNANAAEIAAIRIDNKGWIYLAIALILTLFANAFAGWVWSLIFKEFKYPLRRLWAIQIYLKTTIAKYLPGNVWHFYGRISSVTAVGVPAPTATLCVLLEPVLMGAAALVLVLVGSQLYQGLAQNFNLLNWQVFCLVGVLIVLHPRFLNPLLQVLGKFNGKGKNSTTVERATWEIEAYPLIPLLGEIGFLGLRSLGFLLVFLALTSVTLNQIPLLLSAFNLAWLSPALLPAAPGGIGVFEATAIALLDQSFSPGIVLSVVAIYRLISILAEAVAAGIASLHKRKIQ